MDHNDIITILTCRSENARAGKKFSKAMDGSIIKESYSAGTFFNYETKSVSSLGELKSILEELSFDQRKCIIRGVPKLNISSTVRRKIHEPNAAFDSKSHYWVICDLDKIQCPSYIDVAKNPEEAARWVLHLMPEAFRNADCIWKFSSSQNIPKAVGDVPPSTISLHLAFWCNRLVDENEWKQYFKIHPAPVDQALFSPVQIHFTATPVFSGIDDPLPQRIGLLKGSQAVVQIPFLPEHAPPKIEPRAEKNLAISQEAKDKAKEILKPYYEEGIRDRICGAISGTLYRRGWKAEDIAEFILDLAHSNDDSDAMERHNSALRICYAIDNNRPAQGLPTLKDEFQVEELEKILDLLGVGKPNIDSEISKLSNNSSSSEIESVMKMLLFLSNNEQAIYLERIKNQTKMSKSMLKDFLKNARELNISNVSGDEVTALIEAFLDKYYKNGRLLMHCEDGNYWSYNERFWEITNENLLMQQLIPLAQQYITESLSITGAVTNALRLLKGRVYRPGDPLRLHGDVPSVINCRNGELWFSEDGEVVFKPHCAESYLWHCLEVDYSPEMLCPKFDEALKQIFGKSESPEEMGRHFMELVGYICQSWRKIAAIVILYGSGSNGKTSLMSIVERLLSESSVMSDRISEVEQHTFKVGALSGKLLFVDDDVDMGTCLPDGFLKKISEEKLMTGQHKYRNPFTFKCRAVPVLLANSYPSLKDISYGIQRRMIVIPFDRKFGPEDAKPGLFDDIWEQEASGILNRAVQGFQRLRKRERFEEPKDCISAKNAWFTRSNILVTFLEEICKKGDDHKQHVTELYNCFRSYCSRSGVVNIMALQGFKSRLQSIGYDLSILDGYTIVRGIRCDAQAIEDPF